MCWKRRRDRHIWHEELGAGRIKWRGKMQLLLEVGGVDRGMCGGAMRLSFSHLLTGVLLAVWCAALSGLALPLAPQSLLVLHLLSSVGGLVPLVVFLSRHWWPRRAKIGQHRNSLQGYIALACFSLLLLSGLALLYWTNVAVLRGLHTGAMIVLLIDLTVHMSWRVWKNRSAVQPPATALARYPHVAVGGHRVSQFRHVPGRSFTGTGH